MDQRQNFDLRWRCGLKCLLDLLCAGVLIKCVRVGRLDRKDSGAMIWE